MSTKKRFSIAPELANGLRNTIQSASLNQGKLHYDMMPLELIEPDPNNPRKLLISRDEILHGVNTTDPDYPKKINEREALVELSESIKKIGIKNAIEVFKNGLNYQIITGERRYWAAILAGQKSVPTRISQKPDEFNLRYTQWAENIIRQDLSLWEKFNNLILIADAYKKSNEGEFTAETLKQLLGLSNTHAYRYFSLLKADDKITHLLEIGKLNNLKIVQELISMKDKGVRNQILSWISSSKEEVTSLATYREAAGIKHLLPKQKKEQYVSLGKIRNTMAKQLLDIVLSDARLEKYRKSFKEIDWTSAKAISRTFKGLFKAIENEFNTEETV